VAATVATGAVHAKRPTFIVRSGDILPQQHTQPPIRVQQTQALLREAAQHVYIRQHMPQPQHDADFYSMLKFVHNYKGTI